MLGFTDWMFTHPSKIATMFPFLLPAKEASPLKSKISTQGVCPHTPQPRTEGKKHVEKSGTGSSQEIGAAGARSKTQADGKEPDQPTLALARTPLPTYRVA